jgi:hypothetical protein
MECSVPRIEKYSKYARFGRRDLMNSQSRPGAPASSLQGGANGGAERRHDLGNVTPHFTSAPD